MERSATPMPYVVGLACSAGGFDALTRIVSDLPAGFPATVIVLRHQRPHPGGDLLLPLLSRRSALPCAVAHDNRPVVPGTVIIAPRGQHTLITPDRHIILIESGDRPPYRPSADLLFVSMALAAGPRAVAVVLSGYGNDGATGATAVHRLGGRVIVSDQTSSKVFVMPAATLARDDIVDCVVPVESIAPTLVAMVEGPQPRTGVA
ncbi:chemotaxis protein CheB [Actinoplanes sp. LDG1-06]|uniref:protein-glutamate methylesterase n=1 Tax=Paractinoplanes ovalisporus TaxID=2810368 RepID=A0ABS2A982_9ACTN|nr:chemotaxis protein CheB [Actinoplanes ovalisporus]MBM2616390.1 chemotaxis protein CheB [Actinoplanes ovalisporus]